MSNELFVNFGGGEGLANPSNSSSRWLTEEVFKLIDMVQSDEAIYNPRHKYYFCRPYVENFWREVDAKLEKNPGASLAKWTNLRISFRREYTNYLEEKVPPCWSYFDRMFFLHPYLRKKHQHSKLMESHVQDALVHMTNFSNRFQRERALLSDAISTTSSSTSHNRILHAHQDGQHPMDNYLDYLDENSESDDLLEEEQQVHFRNVDGSSLTNEIKSECEDFDEIRNEDEAEEKPTSDQELHNFVMSSIETVPNSSSHEKRIHLRNHSLNRLPFRGFHDDETPTKRPRSHDSIGNAQINAAFSQRSTCPSTPSHSNVSFVRPTIAKPIDLGANTSFAHQTNHGNESNGLNLATTSTPSQSQLLVHHTQSTQRHLSHHHLQHHRQDGTASSANTPTSSTTNNMNSIPTSTHIELCDCKTDPDAMFLMSLLPDIQKLNGRDRGKIKIAFQNILQDYLYPD